MQALLEGVTQEERSIVCFRDGRITRVGGIRPSAEVRHRDRTGIKQSSALSH